MNGTKAAFFGGVLLVGTALLSLPAQAGPGVPTCDGLPVTMDLSVVPPADPDGGPYGQPSWVATPGSDVILGTDIGESVLGLGGGDHFCAGGGRDVFRDFHGGRDRVFAGPGPDHISIGAGGGLVVGGSGPDTVKGGSGEDTFRGGTGNDVLFGWQGRDLLDGGPGGDYCIAGPGRDTTTGCEVITERS